MSLKSDLVDMQNACDKINSGVNILSASSAHGLPAGSDLHVIAKNLCEMLKQYYYNAGYTQIQVPDHSGPPGSLITLSLTEIFDVATLIEALPYNSASQNNVKIAVNAYDWINRDSSGYYITQIRNISDLLMSMDDVEIDMTNIIGCTLDVSVTTLNFCNVESFGVISNVYNNNRSLRNLSIRNIGSDYIDQFMIGIFTRQQMLSLKLNGLIINNQWPDLSNIRNWNPNITYLEFNDWDISNYSGMVNSAYVFQGLTNLTVDALYNIAVWANDMSQILENKDFEQFTGFTNQQLNMLYSDERFSPLYQEMAYMNNWHFPSYKPI